MNATIQLAEELGREPAAVTSHRILVGAYACSPRMGSEHGVGWGFICELAKRHHVCVIAEEEKCRADVEACLEENPDLRDRLEFHFIRKRRGRLLRKIWPPSYYYFYREWQQAAYKLACRLHAQRPFTLAHQLTMVGYREPGYLWQLGIPFVWGPIGGMGRFPWRFLRFLGARGALYYVAYNLINAWQERFASRPAIAAKAAGAALFAATPDDLAGTKRHWGRESVLLSEVGLPPRTSGAISRRRPGEPLRVVWSGLHIPRKALPLGLRALQGLPAAVDWELDVLGQGPKTPEWRAEATRLGLGERCRFHGWIPRDEAVQVMQRAHVMLITSLRDLTSTVTVEALAQGLPIVCLDHCGFSAAVDESCGLKVPVTTPDKAIAGLRDALVRLDDEELRARLAEGALVRSRMFSWAAKAEVIERAYLNRLGEVSE